jgi:unsaturated chondroitin disaccharide hydrolase
MRAARNTTKALLDDAAQRLVQRVRTTAKEMDGRFPHAAAPDTGLWHEKAGGAWTDGFWPALCWLAYEVTRDERFRDWAVEAGLRLRSREKQQSHDIGFLFYYGAVRGWLTTRDPRLKEMGLRAADRLASMFHSTAGVIPVGSHAEVSSGLDDVTIDCMMNLQLLWWAARETGEGRYRQVAISHAERTAAWHLRSDGSCFQSVHFDRATGQPCDKHTHQGWSSDGCWSRGLAWCCYGFLEAYRATSRPDFLAVSRRALDYHLRHAPPDEVTFNDYSDPRIPTAPRDTSAAAILASALLELSETDVTCARAAPAAERMLAALVTGYLTPVDERDARPPGMLLEGCYNERTGEAPAHELIWGDFFLFEALVRWQAIEARRRSGAMPAERLPSSAAFEGG